MDISEFDDFLGTVLDYAELYDVDDVGDFLPFNERRGEKTLRAWEKEWYKAGSYTLVAGSKARLIAYELTKAALSGLAPI